MLVLTNKYLYHSTR